MRQDIGAVARPESGLLDSPSFIAHETGASMVSFPRE